MKKISVAEILILGFTFLLVISGILLSYSNLDFFLNHYVIEDGFIEWLTVAGLLTGAIVNTKRAFDLRRSKSFLFCTFTLGLGILMFVATGEELSWGQRIFQLHSPEFFLKNNAQEETNLHNLVSNGIKVNRVLSTTITVSLIVYMILIPILYIQFSRIKNLVNTYGIVLPKIYQTAALLLITVLTYLVPHGKRAELLEFGMVFIFLLIVLFPMNGNIFPTKDVNEK